MTFRLTEGDGMPTDQAIGLIVSFFAGAVFLLCALAPVRRRRVVAPEPPPTPAVSDADVYWPLLLGTRQRTFGRAMRLAIVEQLACAEGDWRIPILLCAREQERDLDMLAAIERALGAAVTPVIGSPQ